MCGRAHDRKVVSHESAVYTGFPIISVIRCRRHRVIMFLEYRVWHKYLNTSCFIWSCWKRDDLAHCCLETILCMHVVSFGSIKMELPSHSETCSQAPHLTVWWPTCSPELWSFGFMKTNTCPATFLELK